MTEPSGKSIGGKKCQAWWWYYPYQDRGIRENCDQTATHNIKGELLCDRHYEERARKEPQ